MGRTSSIPAGKMNNRATVAARMNRLITDGPRPFWGAPRAADATTHLSKTKPIGPQR